jgi:hypothetical protein
MIRLEITNIGTARVARSYARRYGQLYSLAEIDVLCPGFWGCQFAFRSEYVFIDSEEERDAGGWWDCVLEREALEMLVGQKDSANRGRL